MAGFCWSQNSLQKRMAGFCWSPDFLKGRMGAFLWSPGLLKENEESQNTKDLRESVQKFGAPQIKRLIAQIEDGLNNIDNATTAEGASSEFGRLLIENLCRNPAQKYASKLCFLDRLKQETRKVIRDVLKDEDNIKCVAGGLSVVAYIMEELKEARDMGREYRHYLLYMLGLLKHMNQQLGWELTKEERGDVLHFIVFCSLLVNMRLKHKSLYWCGADLNVADMESLEFRLGSSYKDLAFGSIKKSIPTPRDESHTRRMNEVGIKEARDLVIHLLDFNSDDKSRRAIVIEGPDGIGKTTVANAAFDSLELKRFQVSRVHIDYHISEPDIKILQQQILHDFFGKSIALRNSVEGRAHLSNAFREEACRPVFIFIDNANFEIDLAKLLPAEEEWLPIQSRIIITTPERSLCSVPAYIKPFHYEMKRLADAEAKNIFQKDKNREEAILSLMKTCRGIPLALTMIASYLRQHGDNVSAKTFESIKPSSTKAFDICSSIVRFIYDSLNKPEEKEAFLDIAIFFNNWDRHLVARFFSDIQLNVLEDKGLIMVSREDRLSIHSVVRKIATQISGKERITDMESLKDALNDEKKLSEVKGIWVSESKFELQLDAADLDKMHRSLRVLHLGKSTKLKGECRNKFENLRFFYQYNKDCLPLGFGNFARVAYFRGNLKKDDYFDELKEFLDVQKLCVTSGSGNLPSELQLANSLHVLDLSDSLDIVKLPKGFSFFYSLEELDLSKCVNLTELPQCLGQLKSLYQLNLRGCLKLKELPETLVDLSCLVELDCAECSQLKKLPEKFGQLKSLSNLQLKRCSELVSLPESFGNLSCLQHLDLSYCTLLSELPNSFQKLSSLSLLRLTRTGLAELPENFGNLSSLKELNLSESGKLKSLSILFPSKKVDLPGGQNLERPGNLFPQMGLPGGQKAESPADLLPLMGLPGGQELESPGNLLPSKQMRLPGVQKSQSSPNLFSPKMMVLPGDRKLKSPCNLFALKKMDLSGSQSSKIPEGSFGKLQTLCRLYLQNCSQLTSLSEHFSRLYDLEELDLSGCTNLASLPEYFGHFKCLRVLKLSCSRLTALPLYIGFMISLQQMTLTDCQKLARLSYGICELKSLSYLQMKSCSELNELPLGFDKLNSLEELDITGCRKLNSLPNQPPSLRVLKLQGCSDFTQLPENIDKLTKLEELVLTDSEKLESLPRSLSEIKSLLHLRLRGASKLTSLPENLSSSIETLDLRGCWNLRMQRQGIEHYSSLKLLLLDGCSELSRLSDDFGLLSSLRYLSIASCTELNRLPDHLESMANLVAVDASTCPRLQGETMDRLAELRCLYFVDVRGSNLLIKRWKQRRDLHNQLLVRLQKDEEEAMYADTIISCLSLTGAIGTERFALVVTCCSDSQDVVNKKGKLHQEGFHIRSIHMTHTSEICSEVKSQNLLCFAMLRWLKILHPETFATLEILHTWIVTVDVCIDKEDKQQLGNMKVELPAGEDGDLKDSDLEALTDTHGGLGRFFPLFLGMVADNFSPPPSHMVDDGDPKGNDLQSLTDIEGGV